MKRESIIACLRCRVPSLFLVFLIRVVMTPCVEGQSPKAATQVIEATWTQEPESVLPQPERLPAWRRDGDIDLYSSETLYEYIDGAAEAYLNYGFRKLATCRYVQKENKNNEITVDVYDMGIPLQAYGIYASERSTENEFMELGGQGYASDTFLGFWQAKFYVKMVFFGKNKDPKGLLVDFARQISASIKGNPPKPKFFELFPKRNRIPNTEQIFLKAPLGHKFLAPAYQVSYTGRERPAAMVVSLAESPSQAAQRLENYREHLDKTKAADSVADGFPEGCVRVQDRYLGKCVVGKVGPYLVFFLGEPEEGTKIMANLWRNLKETIDEKP